MIPVALSSSPSLPFRNLLSLSIFEINYMITRDKPNLNTNLIHNISDKSNRLGRATVALPFYALKQRTSSSLSNNSLK